MRTALLALIISGLVGCKSSVEETATVTTGDVVLASKLDAIEQRIDTLATELKSASDAINATGFEKGMPRLVAQLVMALHQSVFGLSTGGNLKRPQWGSSAL